MDAEVKILTSPGYLVVLRDHKILTVATIVDGHESHHQIDALVYDTADKVDARMEEILAQVVEELGSNDSRRRRAPVPDEIQAMVDAAMTPVRRLH